MPQKLVDFELPNATSPTSPESHVADGEMIIKQTAALIMTCGPQKNQQFV